MSKFRKICFFSSIVFIFFFIIGCNYKSITMKKYKIGLDETFYPLDLGNMEKNVSFFTQELILDFADEMNIRFEIYKSSFENLLKSLNKEKYAAAIVSIYPYNFEKENYVFSDIFLNDGMAMVTKKNMGNIDFNKFDQKLIGYVEDRSTLDFISNYPKVIFKPYENIASMLEDIEKGFLDGGLTTLIIGRNFVNNLYKNILYIEGLEQDKGLRFIAKKENKHVIEVINQALDKLKKSGRYNKDLRKWKLF